jgi:hypothetical protein
MDLRLEAIVMQDSLHPLRAAVSLLSHGSYKGSLGIRAEHIKAWLRGEMKEEDPETAASHVGAGKMWHEFVCLCSSIWNIGAIPQQMSWVITVLIPKGGGVPWHWTTGTNLESAREDDGPQAGGYHLAG